MSTSAPPLMHFPLAKRFMQSGYALRRATWTGATDEHELAWITYSGGLYFYRNEDGIHVVKSTEIGLEDLLATDWTTLPPTCSISDATDCACATSALLLSTPSYPADATTHPAPSFDIYAANARMGLYGCALPPADWQARVDAECACAGTSGGGGGGTDPGIDCPPGYHQVGSECVRDDDPIVDCPQGYHEINGVCVPDEGGDTNKGGGGSGGNGGGGSSGNGGGGGGGDNRPGGYGTGGGGGGGSGGGGGGNRRPRRPATVAATATITAIPSSTDCVDTSARIASSFYGEASLSAPGDPSPSTQWFYTITANNRIVQHGLLAPGNTVGYGPFECTGAAGAPMRFHVSFHRPGTPSGDCEASATSYMQDVCCPDGMFWDVLNLKCENCPDAGQHWDPILQQCVTCGVDEYWNAVNRTCDTCPGDTVWDAELEECVCPDGSFAPGPPCAVEAACIPVCPPGETYNSRTCLCE